MMKSNAQKYLNRITLANKSRKSSLFKPFQGLIDCGLCLVNSLDVYGRTGLILCACENTDTNLEIAKFLIDRGGMIKFNQFLKILNQFHSN